MTKDQLVVIRTIYIFVYMAIHNYRYDKIRLLWTEIILPINFAHFQNVINIKTPACNTFISIFGGSFSCRIFAVNLLKLMTCPTVFSFMLKLESKTSSKFCLLAMKLVMFFLRINVSALGYVCVLPIIVFKKYSNYKK